MRQYWIPVVPAAHLSEAGRPMRVSLLGEDLVLFRTTAGEVGLIGAFCPHRLAPLILDVSKPTDCAARIMLEICA